MFSMKEILYILNLIAIGGILISCFIFYLSFYRHRNNKNFFYFSLLFTLITIYSLSFIFYFDAKNELYRRIFYYLRFTSLYFMIYTYLGFAGVNWMSIPEWVKRVTLTLAQVFLVITVFEVEVVKKITFEKTFYYTPITFYIYIAMLYLTISIFSFTLLKKLVHKEISRRVFLPIFLASIVISIGGTFDIIQFLCYNDPDKWYITYPFSALLSVLGFIVSYANMISILEQKLERNRVINTELKILSAFQRDILPQASSYYPNIDISTFNIPAKEVGGDFYDIVSRDNSLTALVGDVSGKSLPAAFYMYFCYAVSHTLLYVRNDKKSLIEDLNYLLGEKSRQNMFLTLAMADYDYNTGELTLYSAGHIPFLFFNKKNNIITEINPSGKPLGILKRAGFSKYSLKPEIGDILLIFTDGVSEAENLLGEEFGYSRIKHYLNYSKDFSAQKITDGLSSKLKAFVPEDRIFDDITLIAMKWI